MTDLDILAEQERTLQFTAFGADVAWALGSALRTRALTLARPVAIGIWLAGQTLFFAGTPGITPGNEDWLRRKRNTVVRFGRSSLRIGLELAAQGATLESKQGLALADYAAHGGGFPVLLRNTGCVGAIVVSGLAQREDHALVVDALAEILGVDPPRLPA